MSQNGINVFYTGCNIEHLEKHPDLKLTIEMYMKLQMEYLFSRTSNISMQTVPGDINSAKLMVSVIVDRQMIDFIDDWTNSNSFDKMQGVTVNFMSINPDGTGGISALGFVEIKPIFDNYGEQRKGNWFDKIVEGSEYVFEFEGVLLSNSPHYEIILRNFVNVTPPAAEDFSDLPDNPGEITGGSCGENCKGVGCECETKNEDSEHKCTGDNCEGACCKSNNSNEDSNKE